MELPREKAREYGLCFYDPEDTEAAEILNGIHEDNGETNPINTPSVILPCGPGYFWAVNVDINAPLLERWKTPRVGYPEIWGKRNLWTSRGEPVYIVSNILEALALVLSGLKALAISSKDIRRLRIETAKKPASGPLVFLAEYGGPSYASTLEDISLAFESKGQPIAVYDFSNYEIDKEGPYYGAWETYRKGGAGALEDLNKYYVKPWLQGYNKDKRAEYEKQTATRDYMEDFEELIFSREQGQAIPTGFDNLDKSILDGGLFQGLYILGAVSSLGKTTLALQIADHIAESRDVLLFSLEQPKEEIVAKSISRLSYELTGSINEAAQTSKHILYNAFKWDTRTRNNIKSAIVTYKDTIGPRMFIITKDTREEAETDRITTDTIKAYVQRHVEITGNYPVVFVDYLQAIANTKERQTDKQHLDNVVMELREISKAWSIPIFAISTFNRDNYSLAASMSAFKETGAIEYSSDVLLAIQPYGMGEGTGEADKTRNRRIYAGHREDIDRHVELVVLKNRMGGTGSLHLEFNTLFGYFHDLGLITKEEREEIEKEAKTKGKKPKASEEGII